MEWPIVHERDDGIRPAGRPDECFYCKSKIGSRHAKDCVVVKKKVKIKYIFEIDVDVPHFWTKENIEFHRNESSWCAENALEEISIAANSEGYSCCCHIFEAEYLKDIDTNPQRKIRKEK